LLLLTGCPGPDYEPQVALVQATGAPPTLTAQIVDDDDTQQIRMSRGVAMGVTCWDSCPEMTKSCQALTVTSGDESVISVQDAFRSNGQRTLVLSAHAQGTTTISVHTACGSKTYRARSE
jgi:hypothetical protein